MNRERAEAHLRLLAEEELRRATMLVRDSGYGTFWENDCTPYCAAGHFHYYPSLEVLWGSATGPPARGTARPPTPHRAFRTSRHLMSLPRPAKPWPGRHAV